MSKSLGNCIYLSDDEITLRDKVMNMFTDPNHIKASDPGNTEGNTVFIYLRAFCKDEYFPLFLPEYKNLDELEEHYRRGGLGDVKVKTFLFDVLNHILKPIREKRCLLEKNKDSIYSELIKGCEKARKVADDTLEEVRKAIGLDYFKK